MVCKSFFRGGGWKGVRGGMVLVFWRFGRGMKKGLRSGGNLRNLWENFQRFVLEFRWKGILEGGGIHFEG